MNKKYRVRLTEAENGYGYTGEWYAPWDDDTEAVDEEDAIDICQDWLIDHGDDPDNYIYDAELVEEDDE